jgi:proton glutamate symport protein
MIVGAAIGYLFPDAAPAAVFHASSLQVLSTVFLRLVKCLIVPLLFATLVVGIAGHGADIKRVGRLAFRSILYFEFATILALAVGLLAVNLVKPGLGVSLAAAPAGTGADPAVVRGGAGTHGAAELFRGRRHQ